MTQHPFDPTELDRPDPELEAVAARLEAFAADESGLAPADLADRIRDRVDREPAPGGWWASLVAWGGRNRRLAAAVAVAGVVAVAIVGAVAFGELIGWVRQADVGTSPTPSMTAPQSTPGPNPTVTPSPSPSPTLPSHSPSPSETEDDDDDDDDNSGPGGGGNSGPGGRGNSGPGGGG
jgi:hypothetical protein